MNLLLTFVKTWSNFLISVFECCTYVKASTTYICICIA
ncbi:rCG55704, isoform CRA_b [Rattus norvegicus]|uniref:RCG55704, isoform CRA_b n=1 Tax=Rattus norvegicus TaxID=10116 RepID=A6JR88_RAT|nr:rCG55704, isoform CRA_b [Rattus norvegicus]